MRARSSLYGSPAIENIGSFCDSTSELKRSIIGMPVRTILFGMIRFTGFKEYTQTITPTSPTNLEIKLESEVVTLNEVVVSSSRMSERILEAPVSIQRLSAQQIMATSSGNFYEGLKNLRGVDMATSSAGFQAVNMRGFNTTAPVRVVQFVDGIDSHVFQDLVFEFSEWFSADNPRFDEDKFWDACTKTEALA